MKRVVALVIACAMSLALFGCGKSNGTSTSDKETTKNTVASEDNGGSGNTDATNNTKPDAGAIVLLPGELYQFDKDADGPVIKGLTLKGNQCGTSEFNAKDPDVKGIRCIFQMNEWAEIYLDSAVAEGLWVYVYKHADDAKVYMDMAYTEEDTKVAATCTLTKPEEEEAQWGSFYLNPDDADPGVYDIVFVKDGKAVAVIKALFVKESSIDGKSDDELSAMMKDF